MNRFLPSLLLLSAAAQAQQTPDTLAPRPVALQVPAADSLRLPLMSPGILLSCGQPGTAIEPAPSPPFTTVLPALSRIAGVQVTPYSGMPGAWAAVRLRGVPNSAGYSQPLYVVDGVPVYNTDVAPEQWTSAYRFFNQQRQPNGQPTDVTPFAPGGNPLLDLPVEDIASVEVIKDAAGTARYGLQGGYGVVSITTRRGADGRAAAQGPRVRYAGYGALQQVRRRYQLLDGQQYIDLTQQAWANAGRSGPFFEPNELATRGSADWQDRLFRTAGMHSHNLSLDGYGRGTRYYVAADYLGQSGVLVDSWLKRYSLRANVDQQIGRRLTLSLRASGSQLDQQQSGPEPDAQSLIGAALRSEPLGTEYDQQGLRRYSDPELMATTTRRRPRTRRLLAQLGASYQLLPDLVLSLRGSREAAEIRETVANDPVRYSGYYSGYRIQKESSRTDIENTVLDAALRYQHHFGQRHALTATATYQRQQFKQNWRNEQESGWSDNNAFSQYSYQYRVESLPLHSPAVAAGYVLDGRYEVQASLRADRVVNKELKRDTTFWFPGAQLSWHLSQEPWLPKLPHLSKLTVYGGIGRTAGNLFTQGVPSGQLARTTQLDAGLNSAWLDGRLTVTAAVYQRRTTHAPSQVGLTVASAGGYQSIFIYPDMTLRNQGAELTVGGNWQWGGLRGATSVAAATNFTRVQQLSLYDLWNRKETKVQSIQGTNLEVGKPLARHFVYEEQGFYPAGSSQAGQLRYRDVNQDGYLNLSDGRYQGSGLPRYTLNLTQQLSYQRLQLDVQLDGLFGYQIYNNTLLNLDTPNGRGNKSRDALNYWTPANQNTTIPGALFEGRTLLATEQRLATGDHLRLSQLLLSYAVLRTERRQVSVWVGGQNLLVTGKYRGYDPNVATGGASPMLAGYDPGAYPVARAWQLGVRGQF